MNDHAKQICQQHRCQSREPAILAKPVAAQPAPALRVADPGDTGLTSREPSAQALLSDPKGILGGGSIESQVARLSDARLSIRQRQALAVEIGRVQGNRQLQRVMACLREDNGVHKQSLSPFPQTKLKRSELQRQAGQPQTITMEPEVVTGSVQQVGAGRTGTQEIDALIQRFRDCIQDFWARYARGLESFETGMIFSSEQEAEPQYLNATFKAVGKFVLDKALSEAGKRLGGPWGEIISACKALVEAWVAEQERAASSGKEVKIAEYITSIRNSVGGAQARQMQAIEGRRIPLADQYAALSRPEPGFGQATPQGVIVGEAAEFLRNLRASITAFENSIPPEAAFQQQFIERFAATGQMTGLISQGGQMSGVLHLRMRAYKNGNSWSITETGDSWNLVTTAPRTERLAGQLQTSIAAQNQKPYQSHLAKMVDITVEVEEDWALNHYYDGHIYFTESPENPEYRTNFDPRLFREAWAQSGIKSTALNVTRIRG